MCVCYYKYKDVIVLFGGVCVFVKCSVILERYSKV